MNVLFEVGWGLVQFFSEGLAFVFVCGCFRSVQALGDGRGWVDSYAFGPVREGPDVVGGCRFEDIGGPVFFLVLT